MNNRGQVLVLFVMLLPITFLLIFFVYNQIVLYGEANNQKNLAMSLCNYYKEDKTIKELKEIAVSNDKDQTVKIDKQDGTIKIVLVKNITNLLKKEDKVKTEFTCK